MSGMKKGYLIVQKNKLFILFMGKVYLLSDSNKDLFKLVKTNNNILAINEELASKISGPQNHNKINLNNKSEWQQVSLDNDMLIYYHESNERMKKEINMVNTNDFISKNTLDYLFYIIIKCYELDKKKAYCLKLHNDGHLLNDIVCLSNIRFSKDTFDNIFEKVKKKSQNNMDLLIKLHELSKKIIVNIIPSDKTKLKEVPFRISEDIINDKHINFDIVESELEAIISNMKYHLNKIEKDIIVSYSYNDMIKKIIDKVFNSKKSKVTKSFIKYNDIVHKDYIEKLFASKNLNLDDLVYEIKSENNSNCLSIRVIYNEKIYSQWKYGIDIAELVKECDIEFFVNKFQNNIYYKKTSMDFKKINFIRLIQNADNNKFLNYLNENLVIDIGYASYLKEINLYIVRVRNND